MKTFLAIAAVLLLAAACAPSVPPDAGAPQVGIYEGVLPCADCPGIRTRLTLQGPPDFRYRLEQTYLERNPEPFVEEGVYYILRGNAVDPDATVFEIGADSRRYFQRTGPDTLVGLDREMRPISSTTADLTLRRVP